MQQDQREASQQVQGVKKQITEVERKIQDEEQRLRGIDGGSNSRLVEEKEERIRDRARVVSQLEVLETDNIRQQGELGTAKETAQNIQRQIIAKEQEIQATRHRATELRRAQSQYILVYGPQMQNLLRAIEEEDKRNGWRDKPIGPLGQHIKLLKEDWSPILETIFGKGLSGFIVTNYDDQNLLRTLMNQVRW